MRFRPRTERVTRSGTLQRDEFIGVSLGFFGGVLGLLAGCGGEEKSAPSPRYAVRQLTEDLVGVPVADVWREPRRNSSLETQALLGTTLRIQEDAGDFYRVETTPQQYPGFVFKGDVQTRQGDTPYVSGPVVMASVKKLPIHQEPNEQSPIITSVHSTTILPCTQVLDDKFYEVALPNGVTGYAHKWVFYFPDVTQKHKRDRSDVVQTAETALEHYTNTPYTWGGITADGWDCSGFTMWAFNYNGHELPRDSWQQFAMTIGVEYNADRTPPSDETLIRSIGDLEPGDLAFFSKYKEPSRITHVGIIDERGTMIHASKGMQNARGRAMGRSSFRGDAVFGNYFADKFMGGRRVLPR